MSVILLPDKWRRQPTGPVELNNGPFAERLAAAALPASGGIVRTYSRGKLVEQVAWPSGSGISIAGGIGGLGVHAPTSTTHSLRLHSTANQTNTAWEAPSAAGTWLAVFVRYGNVVGNACIFANASAVVPPYTAWGLFDAGGTGSLRTECTAGGSYQYNDFGTMSNNLLYVAGGRYNGANLTTFANGVFSTPTACTGSLVYPDSADRVPTLGNYYEYSPEDRSFNGQIYLGLLWDYALSDAEIIELSQNPWQVFKKSARILYFPSAGGGATGTGSPAAQPATVSGTATRTVTGSGTPTAQAATAAGTAEREITSSGTLAAQSATVSGTGTVGAVVTGSGSPQAQSATVAGTATRIVTASGTPSAQSATVTGTAEREITSSGTPTAQSATVVGTGQVGNIITGSGTPTAQSATVSGTAEREITASGAVAASSATVAGTAERTITGTGTLSASSATVYGFDSAPADTGVRRIYPAGGARIDREIDGWLKNQEEKSRLALIAREDEEILMVMLALAA